MTQHIRPDDSAPLDGWKAIAGYLGKSVRTAQRWQHEFEMPVHRVGDREGEHVYAYRSELDAWRRRASHAITPLPDSPGPNTDDAAGAKPANRPSLTRLAVSALALTASLALLSWTASSLVNPPPNGAPPADAAEALAQPARYAVSGTEFQAYDRGGRLLWAYDVGRPLNAGSYPGHADPANVPSPEADRSMDVSAQIPPVHFADIDNDGNTEVLLIAQTGDGLLHSTLHCLDARGRRRWTFKSGDALSFGGHDYGEPALIPWVTAAQEPGGAWSVWLVATHSVEYPTIVYRLNPQGGVVARYVSNGRIQKVRFADIGGRRMVILGGVNNERKTAALAVFDLAAVGGAAPAETAKYRCDGCPPQRPSHYLLFPVTRVGALRGGMPYVGEIAVTGSGEVFVSVVQHRVQLPADAGPALAVTYYRLDSAFRVVAADFAGEYAPIHDYFYSNARATRRFDKTAAAELWPVLRWTGSRYARITAPEG